MLAVGNTFHTSCCTPCYCNATIAAGVELHAPGWLACSQGGVRQSTAPKNERLQLLTGWCVWSDNNCTAMSQVPRLSQGAASQAAGPAIFQYQAANPAPPAGGASGSPVLRRVGGRVQRGRRKYMATVLVWRGASPALLPSAGSGQQLSGTWPRSAGSVGEWMAGRVARSAGFNEEICGGHSNNTPAAVHDKQLLSIFLIS